MHPLPIKLATSLRDDRWTVHATAARRVVMSASGGSLQDAFEALHRRSAEAVDEHLARESLRTPRHLDDDRDVSADEESDSDDEDEDEEEAPWGSFSEPYGCCGWDSSRPRTRLLPVTRRRSRMPPNRCPLSSFPPPPPPPPPPPASPSPPPPPPIFTNSGPGGSRLIAPVPGPRTGPVPTSSPAPALLVISREGADSRRVLTRVTPSQRAIERAAVRLVRGALEEPDHTAAAVVRGVGMSESEMFEVDGFGDDLSAVFKSGTPRVYVDVRAPGRGGGQGSESLPLAGSLGHSREREMEN